MSADFICFIATVSAAGIALVSYRFGYAKGEAKGWQDGYFQHIDRERSRRDSLGRFKVEGGK